MNASRDQHLTVTWEQGDGDNVIARLAPPSPGLVAECSLCGQLLRDTDPALITRCPVAGKFVPLSGVSLVESA